MIALSPYSLSAVGPSEIVGAWVMSVDSRLSPESVDLEIDHQPDVWKVTLRSGAGAVTTNRVNLRRRCPENSIRSQASRRPSRANGTWQNHEWVCCNR